MSQNGYRLVGIAIGAVLGLGLTLFFSAFANPGTITLHARQTHGLATACIIFPAFVGGGVCVGFAAGDKLYLRKHPPLDLDDDDEV